MDEASSQPLRRHRSSSILRDERLLPKRFLVVSNRLPYSLSVDGGRIEFRRGVGGLVTALDPILRRTGGTWIGWSGDYGELPERVPLDEPDGESLGYHLCPVHLTREEVERYYLGYSNRRLWPLFHLFQEHAELHREEWTCYREINRRFADAVVREYRSGDLIWIHDYHLMLVPAMVREQLPEARIGFFLHIPFPGDETFSIEPQARELLAGVLGSNAIGFHLQTYARNFIDAVSTLTDHRYHRSEMRVTVGSRDVQLGSYPISVDYDAFTRMATGDAIPEKIERLRSYYRAEIIAVGVDRLDYTKGILQRLEAIERMLDRFSELQGRFTFLQISAPSRTRVHTYQEMRERIEQRVGRINGRFGGRGCIPIDYRYESSSQEDLASYYRAADVALVTPLRDGMNLVAKEYVASRVDEDGVLVLSRFAGAAQELTDAVAVNPYDVESTAEQIHTAIVMDREEKRRRMRRMREIVRRNDIYWWLERVLRDLV